MVVLGAGDTGMSFVRYLASRGARVTVTDTRSAAPGVDALRREFPDVRIEVGGFNANTLASADLLAASPGVPINAPFADAAVLAVKQKGVPVWGDFEFFARAIAALPVSRRPRVMAVTGTNGKSTVTALTGAMAAAAGKRTVVAGNIGVPVLDALRDAEQRGFPDVYALELSSYQLEATDTFACDAATVLNLTQDHLDRYANMAEYGAAKARIFSHCGTRVVNRDDAFSASLSASGSLSFGDGRPARSSDYGIDDSSQSLVRGDERLMALREVPIAGRHNALNALAAIALNSAVGIEGESALEGIRRFAGLPHRVQRVASVRGVTYYDDSKGTNVGATVAALGGMREPVVLIAGGDGKGQDFAPLARAMTRNVRAVVLIGRDAPAIRAALANASAALLDVAQAATPELTMRAAVETAAHAAKAGDAVLLSPACASLDMFRNYRHRGEAFADAVHALAKGAAA